MPNANSTASGTFNATIRAERTFDKNISRIIETRAMPTSRFSWTVSVVVWINSVRS